MTAAPMPTDDDVAFYRAHGWWISPPCLSDDDLELLRFGIERYYAGERDWSLPTVAAADWDPADGDVTRQNDYASLQIDELRRFVTAPILPAIAARLAGVRQIRLFHDQIVYKPPGQPLARTGVGWHTDRAYWGTCTSEHMLTAWIPLHDVDEDAGTMIVIDRSHTWPGGERLRYFHDRDVDAVRARIGAAGAWEEVPYRLRAGQVAFHHCRTIHGSRDNRGRRPRIAWAVHYQDGDNTWQRFCNADGVETPHMNDILCRRIAGAPDYADPDVCPELWREEAP